MAFFCSHFGRSVTMLMLIILLHLLPLPTMASSSPNFMSAEIFPQTIGLGSYFTEIEVGTPPVSQFMVIDTGSDMTWFQCKPCDCDQTPGHGFDPLNSTSFSVVPCASDACIQLRQHGCNNNSQCPFEVDYSTPRTARLCSKHSRLEAPPFRVFFVGAGIQTMAWWLEATVL
jgi:hypothetical protein